MPDHLLHAVGFHLLATFRGSAVLPDDGVVDGFAVGAVPDDGGFALVGDAQTGEVACAQTGFAEDFDYGTQLRGQDIEGVVFYPAALRVDLVELMMRVGDDVAVFAKQNGTRAGGSLIERQNMVHTTPQCRD